MKSFSRFALIVLFLSASTAFAQQPYPYFNFSKGLGLIAPDSSFSINARFRMQNRFGLTSESENDLTIREVEARIRRLRLRFEGFVLSPRLTYGIQLSFSRGDMDYEAMKFPNVIRDAFVQYAFTKSLSVGMGQTKLPGNRQRINSSGDLQLVDRSIVNAAFNIDRDFGIFVSYKRPIVNLRGALSSGEGRNINSSNRGLAYTARIDLTPFGPFKNNGDYFEGDLAREERPKIALGIAYHFNDKATRTNGQTGYWLAEQRNIETTLFDFLWKYRGWSYAVEYAQRNVSNPFVTDDIGVLRYFMPGSGHNHQLSYVFKSNYELVSRYSAVAPSISLEGKERARQQYTVGINKYLKGHRVKIQSDLTLETWQTTSSSLEGKFWNYRFQVEVGI